MMQFDKPFMLYQATYNLYHTTFDSCECKKQISVCLFFSLKMKIRSRIISNKLRRDLLRKGNNV